MNKKTNKTEQVLKLLTKSETGNIENPIINREFKEEVIHVREVKSNRKPAPAVAEQKPANDIGINVVAELVQEWLPVTMKRFNFDNSDIVKAEITVEALNTIPPKYVYIKNETDFANIKTIKEKYKADVINTLVHLTIKAKNNPKHLKIS